MKEGPALLLEDRPFLYLVLCLGIVALAIGEAVALAVGAVNRRSCLGLKIRSYLSPNFSANFSDFRQLGRAPSRLYRSRFLQPNIHFAAFILSRDIQDNHSFAPLQME